MAELKTQKKDKDVSKFLSSIEDGQRKADAFELLSMMKKISREVPKMWGDTIIGFGDDNYKYESGREIDWFKMGFSPRKSSLSLYLTQLW